MMSIPEQIILKFKESPHYSYPDSINQLMLNATMVILFCIYSVYGLLVAELLSEIPDGYLPLEGIRGILSGQIAVKQGSTAIHPALAELFALTEPIDSQEVLALLKEWIVSIPIAWYIEAGMILFLIPFGIIYVFLSIESRALEGDFSLEHRERIQRLRKKRFAYDKWLLMRAVLSCRLQEGEELPPAKEPILLTEALMQDCTVFYRYLEKKKEASGKTERHQYIFQSLTLALSFMTFAVSNVTESLTIGAAAAAVAFVVAAGIILSGIMACFSNRRKTDGKLIDYMMSLLGDVIFFKTPVERPDI